MSDIIREPQQSRSIEKKQKIIEAGLKVFSEKGYYNTNTAEIAKVAGVSTGIVYGYFKDKKDIFLQSLELYFNHVLEPLEEAFDSMPKDQNLEDTLVEFIDVFIKSHRDNAISHEEMLAMSHLDKNVHDYFVNIEYKFTSLIKERLIKMGLDETHLNEKVHIAYNMIESLCHECVYHKHPDIDYDVMKDAIVRLLLDLFNNQSEFEY